MQKTFDPIQNILRSIPRHCFSKSLSKSFYFLLRDYLFATLLTTGIVYFHNWIIGPILAILLGTVLTGIFVLGHDCGHRSFSSSSKINNLVGHLTTTLTYWPFHVWRLSHDIHHRETHHIDNDIAWVPYKEDDFYNEKGIVKTVYRLTRTFLFFTGGIFFTFLMLKDAAKGNDSRYFKQKDMPLVNFSLFTTALYFLISTSLILWFGGFYGFVCLILIPQGIFQTYLSTFTLFHHTNPEIHFMNSSEWTFEKAQLGSSVHVVYPRLIDWLTHDISWHVPHHVSVGIPHYNLRMAHESLKINYPEVLNENIFNLALIKSVLNQCHLVRSDSHSKVDWVTFKEVLETCTVPT